MAVRVTCLFAAGILFLAAGPAGAVDIQTVPVGNPGNDPWRANLGQVLYRYEIGKYEVTAGQYTEFLNAVARTDAYGLYNVNMDTDVDSYGCNIKRTGESGEYSYSVAADWANRPVNYVSWGDAVRFANWMHNGQPNTGVQDASTTEDGSYLLNGVVSNTELMKVGREANATWVLPTRNEWSKAAYHKNDGVTGNYWLYPTSSDEAPSNLLGEPVDPGNNATFRSDLDGAYTIGGPYWRTEVGAHENSLSPYGTLDQAGNVAEWTETGSNPITGPSRVRLGSAFPLTTATMQRDGVGYLYPSTEQYYTGFRLVLVPEPATLALLALGCAGLVRRRRR